MILSDEISDINTTINSPDSKVERVFLEFRPMFELGKSAFESCKMMAQKPIFNPTQYYGSKNPER